MSKDWPICVAGLLLAAGLAAGQRPALFLDEPGPPPGPPPAPAPLAGDGCGPSLVGAKGVLAADLDYALWFMPTRKDDRRTALSTGAGGDSLGGALSSFHEGDLNRHAISGGQAAVGYWLA